MTSSDDARTTNRERFELELEFVQSLANPYYLHSLAQQEILEQPAFVVGRPSVHLKEKVTDPIFHRTF